MELSKIFEALVRKNFGFLYESYGFSYVKTEQHLPEIWTTFTGPSTSIIVHFEMGCPPWIEARKHEKRAGKIIQTGRSLERLLQERAPHEETPRTPIFEVSDPELDRMLQTKARQLREYGDEILRGDIQAFRNPAG